MDKYTEYALELIEVWNDVPNHIKDKARQELKGTDQEIIIKKLDEIEEEAKKWKQR